MAHIKFVLVSVAVTATIGCSLARQGDASAATGETANAQPVAAKTPTPAPKPDATAAAGEEAPDAVLNNIYEIHAKDFKSNKDQFLDGKSRKMLDKFFDKNLANLIWKDLTTNKGEVGVIDFDLFYASQDPNIKNVKVSPAVIKGDSATDIVTFTDSGLKRTLVYNLVKENGSWKISDINYGNEGTLLKYFKDAQQSPSPNQ
jgi:hypothetical protein